MWSRVITTVRRPTSIDLAVRPWIRWIPTIAALALLALWLASAIAEIGSAGVLVWTLAASALIGGLVQTDRVWLARWALAGLAAAVFVPVPPRLRNLRGAFAMIGIPWMTFVLVCSAPLIGRFILYEFGHDYWMYQRYAYRIVMQGYWLEGGSTAFYFQAFYRWIVAALHVVFGDSSAGEWYWDGACLLAGALLSFRHRTNLAGFQWGLVAAALTLAVFVLGTAQYLIGQGLGEISSAGLLSMAALLAIGSRRRRTAAAIGAGILATLAFYTRLNNLIMAAGVASSRYRSPFRCASLIRPAAWWRRIAWRTVADRRRRSSRSGCCASRGGRGITPGSSASSTEHSAPSSSRSGSRGRRSLEALERTGPQRDGGAHGQRSSAVRRVRVAGPRGSADRGR